MRYKFLPLAFIFVFSIFTTASVFAIGDYDDAESGPSCPNLSQTLSYARRLSLPTQEVLHLQSFLTDHLNLNEDITTGFFGKKTDGYVKLFQAMNGIDQTGVVGPITRAKIAEACGGIVGPPNAGPKISILSPLGGEAYEAGSGQPLTVAWLPLSPLPPGSIACVSLVSQPAGVWFAFPADQACSPARTAGVDSRKGYLVRTPGYDLAPGTYWVRVDIQGPPLAGGKDGMVIAKDITNQPILLKEPDQSSGVSYKRIPLPSNTFAYGEIPLLRFSARAGSKGDANITSFPFSVKEVSAYVEVMSLYAYTREDFSLPIPGFLGGYIGKAGSPGLVPSIFITPQTPKGSGIQIPAGMTYYFEVLGRAGFNKGEPDASVETKLLVPDSDQVISETLSVKTIGVLRDTYRGYMGGQLFITTPNITEREAVSNCMSNAANNPFIPIRCTWGDKEIFQRGLCMVPLTIACPPGTSYVSGGTDANGCGLPGKCVPPVLPPPAPCPPVPMVGNCPAGQKLIPGGKNASGCNLPNRCEADTSVWSVNMSYAVNSCGSVSVSWQAVNPKSNDWIGLYKNICTSQGDNSQYCEMSFQNRYNTGGVASGSTSFSASGGLQVRYYRGDDEEVAGARLTPSVQACYDSNNDRGAFKGDSRRLMLSNIWSAITSWLGLE